MTPPAAQDQLLAELDRLGISHRTITHPPVFSVEEAKQIRGKIEGGHTKNLFLKDKKGRLFLAVTLEDVPVDLKALGLLVSASGRLSFASADLLRAHLGVEPGSVTPFSLINDRALTVIPVMDETMLAVTPLNFHPLSNTATTAITNQDLLRFIAAQGHTARCLRFPHRTGEAIS
ncbi:MAG: prolyl-tRNA synthetase associated domain-containing protein [Micropepsaceae bacterium]